MGLRITLESPERTITATTREEMLAEIAGEPLDEFGSCILKETTPRGEIVFIFADRDQDNHLDLYLFETLDEMWSRVSDLFETISDDEDEDTEDE